MHSARLAFLFRRVSLLVAFVGFAMVLSACPCKWPKCGSDSHCKAGKGNNSKDYFCVNGLCIQCKDNGNCAANEKCVNNACVAKTCDDITCKGGKRCNPSTLACEWICQNDGDSPCDGNRCNVCKNHQCVPKPPKCTKSADCPAGQICKNASDSCNAVCEGGCDASKPCPKGKKCMNNQCVEDTCSMSPIYFNFNKYFIRSDAKSGLRSNVECAKKMIAKGKKVMIEGHCDERGTREYNIWLGRRRAKSTKRFLGSLGVAKGSLCTVSKGKEDPAVSNASSESDHQRNRRALFKIVDSCN